jgi:hypothetical protein
MIDFEAWEQRDRARKQERRAELAVTWPELIVVVGAVLAAILIAQQM